MFVTTGASDDVNHICTIKREGVPDGVSHSAVRVVDEFTVSVKLIVGDLSGKILLTGE